MTFVIDSAPSLGRGAICRAILDSVPSWFGIPEANDAYVAFADTHDAWVAYSSDGEPIGLVSGQSHFPETAEIEVIAVRPEWHRSGVGRALVEVFEAHHRRLGARLIEVKTLGPSHPDEGYRSTRAFYTGIGFIPVEEMWIWGPDNPALILCKPVSPAEVAIRPARAHDVDAIANVKVVGWRTTYADLVPPGVLARFLDHAAQREAFAAMLDDPHGLLLVAEVDGDLVGFGTGDTATGYIDSLHVLPEWRGHGVGEQLLDTLATTLFELGCTSVSLHVVAGNERACRFYERLGGEHTGTSPATWASEVTEVHYRWTTWRRRSPARGRR